jgi:murein DD-endopeptidase MepM/ murein hydrolase activator NlpD
LERGAGPERYDFGDYSGHYCNCSEDAVRFPFDWKKITGRFGTLSEYRKANGMQPHSGVDWAMPEKTPIPAIAQGTIVLQQFSKVLGNVSVQRVMSKDGKLWYVGYCHLKAEGLEVGTKVQEGDTIGFVGNTGSASSGAHLHLTVSDKLKGVFGMTSDKIDPIQFIKENK